MLGVALKRPFAADMPIEGEHVLGESPLPARPPGAAALRLSPVTAPQIAACVPGMPAEEVQDPAMIDEAIGELSNMVVGNFKSNLCDAGLNGKLSPPAITRTEGFTLRSAEHGLAERIGPCGPDLSLFLELNANPWAG